MISHPRHDEEYARPPRYHHGPLPQPSTPSGFEDIDFSGDRSGTAVTPLAAWHGPDGRSHGDSQPTQGRGIQQSKILDPPPNVNRIQKRRHSFSKEKGEGGVAGNGTVLSFDYPDDESSTFIRGRNRLRWFSARLMRHARKIMETMARRMEGVVVLLRRKVDPTKVALTGLASLALMFMDFGIASRAPSPNGNGYGAWQARASTSPEGMPSHHSERRSGGGYQARGQVPIPLEYASFVELSEFADAVMVVRAHRQKIMKQQNHHGRRLDEAGKGSDGTGQNVANAESVERGSKRNRGRGKNRNNEGGFEGKTDEASIKETGDQNDVPEATRLGEKDNEEISNMNNATGDAWEQAMQANPDLGSGQEKGLESTKVAHVPFFWHVPRTGGTTLSTLIATCHSLVQATSSFTSPPVFTRGSDEALASRFRDPTLYVVRTHGEQFVNVDLDSLEGVERAVKGGLVEKELADVVAMPDARLGSLLFRNKQDALKFESGGNDIDGNNNASGKGEVGKNYNGVLFAMFRHPIDRAVSWFYHKQSVKESVHFDPSLEIYSLADWINSPSYITNYMVRTLVGKIDSWTSNSRGPFRPPVPLTRDDLDVAKEILRRKCVIGLLEEKGESIKRFEKFFGWNAEARRESLLLLEGGEMGMAEEAQAARWRDNVVKDEECADRLLHWRWENKNRHPVPEEGSPAYNLLEGKNRYDIELYLYARQLFDEQYIQLGFDDDTIGGQYNGEGGP